MVAKNHCLMKLRNKGKYTTEINEQLLSTPFEETDKNEYIVKDNTLNAMAIALSRAILSSFSFFKAASACLAFSLASFA